MNMEWASLAAPRRTLQGCYERLTAEGISTDKGWAHPYIPLYETLLAPYRDRDINVLELGVFWGASIALWRDYFTKATIIGMDVVTNPNPYPDTFFILGDATKPETFIEAPNFDIVIDDASHDEHLIAAAFEIIRPRMNPGGLYVIEDIQDDTTVARMQALDTFEEFDYRSIKNRNDDRLLVWRSA